MSAVRHLPAGWVSTTLGEVAQWGSGGTPSRSHPEFFGGSIPWIKTGELGPRTISHTEEHLTAVGLSSSSAKLFPRGAVAVAMYGATIGKASILGVEAATNQACAVGIPLCMSSQFLHHYLVSQADALADAGKGGAQPNISQGVVRSWPIGLPPLREQDRIVDALDETLSGNDAATAELFAAKRKLALFRQALLKSAVDGTLTADWRHSNPDVEPGGALLSRIGAVCLPVAVDTDLPKIPNSWSWAPLGALGEITSGVAKGSKVRPGEPVREVPYLRVANVQRGYLALSEVKLIPATETDIRELSLKPGDVLFNEGGDRDKLGRGWVWNGEIEECIHQNHVFRLRLLRPDLQPEFISHHGNSFGRHWFEAAGKQTTNLASINLGILRRFPVPVPPSAEQKVIVERLRVELESIAESERAIERGLSMASAQRQNILRAAFSGQLVPQDPNDEPASVLLERIRAQRQAAAPATQRKRGRRAQERA